MTYHPTKLFCDIETSGLLPTVHHVLEVGLIAVDDDYNELGATSFLVPVGRARMMASMDPKVVEMHTQSGLLEELFAAERAQLERLHMQPEWAYKQASTECVAFLVQHSYQFGDVILCGNSIHFDRGFIDQLLPAFGTCLSYRMRDFSGIEKFLRHDCQIELPPLQEMPHRGLADARIELEMARSIRKILRQEFGGTVVLPLPKRGAHDV